MTGSHRVVVTLLFAALLTAAACGPSKQPPPVDPLKEQISVVQRQLLELQKVQLETRRKVDEQAAVNDALAAKVKALEDYKNAPPPPAPVLTRPTSTSQAAPAKKTSKKTAKKPAKKKKKKPAAQSQQ